MITATYSRSTTLQQKDGTSLTTQGERTGAMAKQMGFEMPEEFALKEIWTGPTWRGRCWTGCAGP